MAKPIQVLVAVDEAKVFSVLRRLRKIVGVIGFKFNIDQAITPGSGGAHNGAGRPRKPKHVEGSPRLALLKLLADGKVHERDAIREASGLLGQRWRNVQYNAKRDGAIREPAKGRLQITAKGQAQLKG